MATKNKSPVVLLTVPFPAQSHLNQLLQFSCLIASSYSLPVHYVASGIHSRQARSRVDTIVSKQVHFHDMPLPEFESPAPDAASGNTFASQFLPCWYASLSLRQPFAAYLLQMSKTYTRVVVVHDPMMAAVVQDVAFVDNAEAYVFNCVSVFFRVPFRLAKLGKPLPLIYPDLPALEGCLSDEVIQFLGVHQKFSGTQAGDIHNACRSIEGPYLKLLESEEIAGGRRSWAVGPVFPMIGLEKESVRHECLEWLDKQEPNSVIYVSFGTTTSLSDEQIKELAYGLEQSKVKFLWVLRDADKPDIFDDQQKQRPTLPDLFEQRVEGVGLVVRDWIPQMEILKHPSTGGFMSHCGWNSCMESITMGVPVAAWPMHSDQPMNATFITEVLKMGILVRDWSRRHEIVKADIIENTVKRLLEMEEGMELRKTAEKMAFTVQQATQAGGASRVEMDSFVAHITR